MISVQFCFHLTVLLVVSVQLCLCLHNETVRLPGFKPSYPNEYVCTAKKLDPDTSYYIRGFSPADDNGAAHHILLYGCQTPGVEKDVWLCGEMSKSAADEDTVDLVQGGVCGRGGSNILFAEAMQAGSYKLPEDVSFKIGKDTNVKYLVIQVHYKDVSKFEKDPALKDYSGIDIEYQKNPTELSGGVLLLGSGGVIRPNRGPGDLETLDIVCPPEEIPREHSIVPFAFRTHAHSYGVLISGFQVKTNPWNHQNTWTMIGRMSPKMEQTFYPCQEDIIIEPSDRLFARCTYTNPTDKTVPIGPTSEDEMCNFYMMYYTLSEGPAATLQPCFSAGVRKWEQSVLVPEWVEEASLFLSPEEQDAVRKFGHG